MHPINKFLVTKKKANITLFLKKENTKTHIKPISKTNPTTKRREGS